MVSKKSHPKSQGQAAIEYLILLGLVALIAMVGFTTYLPRTQQKANAFFDDTSRQLYGDIPSDGKAHTSLEVPYP